MPKFEKIAHGTADAIRKVTGREKYKITDAVILAAGSSTRMGGADKQFLELDGMPVIARTIKAFEDAPCIREVVIVTKPESVEKLRALCEKYGFKKIRAIVKGGETRQESAWLGFAELPDETEFVAIHDGARCLVTPHMIEDVARQNSMPKSANVVLLGMAARYIEILSAEQLRESIKRVFAAKGEAIVEMNLCAFDLGWNAVNEQ